MFNRSMIGGAEMASAMWARRGPRDGFECGGRSYVPGSEIRSIAMMNGQIRATIVEDEHAARGPLADFVFHTKSGQLEGPAAELRVEDP